MLLRLVSDRFPSRMKNEKKCLCSSVLFPYYIQLYLITSELLLSLTLFKCEIKPLGLVLIPFDDNN